MVRPHDGESGRPRGADDRRTRQAARRKPRRDRLRSIVHRMVRRRRQARLRRCHSRPWPRQAHRRAEAADRRDSRDHAVEFSGCDDRAQSRSGAGGGLHDGDQALRAHPLLRIGDVRARRARGHSRRCDLRRHGRFEGHRRRAYEQSHRAQAELHGLDRRGQIAHAAVRIDGKEGVAGTGRQCAVHRVRRCRSRQRGSGRDRLEIPQCRPDLRVRESPLCAKRHLRAFRREARAGRRRDEGRQRLGARYENRTADRRRRRRKCSSSTSPTR